MAEGDDNVTKIQKRFKEEIPRDHNVQDSVLNALRVRNLELRKSANLDKVHKKALHPDSLTEASKLRDAERFLGDKPSGGLPYNIEVPGLEDRFDSQWVGPTLGEQGNRHPELQQEVLKALEDRDRYLRSPNGLPYPGRSKSSTPNRGGGAGSGGQGSGGSRMSSGSREYDFNEMAKLGGAMSQNQKALEDVRSSFVGPVQEESDPVPTEVDLGDDAPMPTEVNLDSVNEKELAYAAKRRMEEDGHPGADMLLTPSNIKKLAQFETKARRVESQRQAYEQDPQKYEMDTADALDGYTKSWVQRYQLDHQGEGAARGVNAAVREVGQAEAPSAPKEIQGMDSPRGQGPRAMSGASSGGEAPAPRGQQSGGTERRPDQGKVPAGDTKPKADLKSVARSAQQSGVKGMMTGAGKYTEQQPSMASTGMSFKEGGASKVARVDPSQRGEFNPDEPSTNSATRAALAEFIPSSIIPTALGVGALKSGLPGKMAKKIESEVIPAVGGMARRMAGKAEAEAAPVVNNISKVAKPMGLRRAEARNAAPSRADVQKTIKNATPAPTPKKPTPKKNATEVAHKASEYLDDTEAIKRAREFAGVKPKKEK